MTEMRKKIRQGSFGSNELAKQCKSPKVYRATPADLFRLETGFCYLTLTFRMFSILQQLHLISGARLLPSFMSFIPFTAASPLQLPPPPSSLDVESILTWGTALVSSAAPFFMILAHGRIKLFVSRKLYRPIYKSLPRPIGDSIFSGLSSHAPLMEYDTPDITIEEERSRRGEDTPTLRALEGLPALDRDGREEMRTRQSTLDAGDDSSEDGNDEMQQATLISFDVEATEAVENSFGTWSAELRSANEPVPLENINYRTTGLTMLPVILAAEGMREIIAGLLVLPLEAVMVRVIARAYRQDAGLSVTDLYSIGATKGFLGRKSLIGVLALQVALTGAIWAGFTVTTQWLTRRRVGDAEGKEESPP